MTDDEQTRSKRSTALVLPLFASACAIGAVLLLLTSGLGARLHLWHFRTGFTLITAAAYIGLCCSLLALISGVLSWRKRHPGGVLVSVIALILAVAAFSVPVYWKIQRESYPRIHDISTDLDHPPRFVAVSSLRKTAVRHGGAEVAAQQLKAYPDLKTVVLPLSKDQAFQHALGIARDLGWEIVATAPAEGRIEATDTTRWFGFKDDISIRIYPAGDRSLLDIRSVSRVGVSDVGTNAKRIRAFLAKLAASH